ncbi:MAG: helix-hairpin-helix domain-containing protein [Clostridiales bacterium]|nr:helix-hairpin-helix domain-containing protein [Clostridiales bacterium]
MELNRKEKVGLLVFAAIVLLIASLKYYNNIERGEDININNQQKEVITNNKFIEVYICGEVNKPGVYKMVDGDRVNDLIKAAGGFTNKADLESVNLAIKLKDEDYIKIPSKIILENTSEVLTNTQTNKQGKININTAGIEELKTLPRIGDSIAKRIIDYRNKNGRFKRIEDIKNVSGIGEKMFENIKDLICVY